ncbi:MAG: hypothetical protein WCV93_00490 [Candidatus Shapirobacteria bacterium]|jgi:hypothetical protein
MNKKNQAIIRMKELDGDTPERINELKTLLEDSEKGERIDSIKSWLTIGISIVALIISVLVAVFK